jgi:hypothetical protein
MLTDAMKKQFDEAFDVLAGSIPLFTDEQWRQGRPAFDGPARCTVHALQAAIFYTCGDSSIFSRGIPIWQATAQQLPSQQDMLTYLAEARAKTAGWIDSIGDGGLAQPDNLGRVVYALRHLQHHTGEMCAYQKAVGKPQTVWT